MRQKGSTLNVSSDSIKYKHLVLAVKRGSVIPMSLLIGKGSSFAHAHDFFFFLGMLKNRTGESVQQLIWSGLISKHAI